MDRDRPLYFVTSGRSPRGVAVLRTPTRIELPEVLTRSSEQRSNPRDGYGSTATGSPSTGWDSCCWRATAALASAAT